MDFDPGFHEEMYDDEQAELDCESEPEETDDLLADEFSAAELAGAAGFGYHMAQEELEERKLAEDILKRKDKTNKEPKRVSLKSRRGRKYTGTPSQRWMYQVASGEKNTKDPVEYTDAEKKAILQHEGEHDFEW